MDTVYSSEDIKKLEQKTPWFEWVYAAIAIIIFFFILSKYKIPDLKKIFSSKKTKNKKNPTVSPLIHKEKKESVSQHSPLTSTKSHHHQHDEIEMLSYSSALSSEPKTSNHSSKQHSSSKTTYELMTTFIRTKLQQRKEERLNADEEIKKAKKEKMDSYKSKKAAKESSSLSLLEAKPTHSETEEETPKQNKEMLLATKERSHEAEKKLNEHASALLKISFIPSDNKAIKQQDMIKNLAFIYHFHRFNFARTLLQNQIFPDDGRQLRTLIVHATNKVTITTETIIQTQQQLKQFIVNDVNDVTAESMQTLPLTKAFKEIQDQLDQHPASPAQLSVIDYYQWMKNKIVPFMNLLNAYVTNNQGDIHSINEYRAAINMLIIICGEYCAHHQIQKFYYQLEPLGSVGFHPLYEFVKQVRGIRNKLCHDIFDVADDEINSLLQLALKINPHAQMNACDTFLMPGAEVKLDATSMAETAEKMNDFALGLRQ